MTKIMQKLLKYCILFIVIHSYNQKVHYIAHEVEIKI